MNFDLPIQKYLSSDYMTSAAPISAAIVTTGLSDPLTIAVKGWRWSMANGQALLSQLSNSQVRRSDKNEPEDSLQTTALFDKGMTEGSLISRVVSDGGGAAGEATHQRMRGVLTELGVNDITGNGHRDHFNIDLQAPRLVRVKSPSANLPAANLATDSRAGNVSSASVENPIRYAGVFGACNLLDVSRPDPESDWHKVYPAHALVRFLKIQGDAIFDAKVRMVKPPMRGSIRDYSQSPYKYKDGTVDNRSFEYAPDKFKFPQNVTGQYLGKDQATFEVEYKGKLYKVVYDLHVVSLSEKAYLDGSDKKCRYVDPVNSWRISGSDLEKSPTEKDGLKAWRVASDIFSILAVASDVTLAFDDLQAQPQPLVVKTATAPSLAKS